MVSLPKKAIEDVCKVAINQAPFLKNKKKANDEEKALFNNMFEIYLRADYEDVYMFRDEELELV